MLEELFPLISEGNHYICLTRPRRFGKTIMANMIASFFSRACDSKILFDQLAVAGAEEYESYRNKYHVVHISFNDVPRDCSSYGQYIKRIENRLGKDLVKEFPFVRTNAVPVVGTAISRKSEKYAADNPLSSLTLCLKIFNSRCEWRLGNNGYNLAKVGGDIGESCQGVLVFGG